MKKHILRIYDFIRSWIYYPKLHKYLTTLMSSETATQFIEKYNTRWKYALWHCKVGRLSDRGYKILKPTTKDVGNDWKSVYRYKPVEKR